MALKWTRKGLSDLSRLYEFLASVNQLAAARTVQMLSSAPVRLETIPRLGERLVEFEPREVRRLMVSRYEIRYEILGESIYILRLWHSREDR